VGRSRNGTRKIHGSSQVAYNVGDKQPLGESWGVTWLTTQILKITLRINEKEASRQISTSLDVDG